MSMSNDSRFIGTFECVLDKFSEMVPCKKYYFKPYTIGRLSWKVNAEICLHGDDLRKKDAWKARETKDRHSGLSISIDCGDDQTDSWMCYAVVSLSLLANQEFFLEKEDSYSSIKPAYYQTEIQCLFYPGKATTGMYLYFTNYYGGNDKVINKYVKDDKIIIRAHIEGSYPLVGASPDVVVNPIPDSKPINASTTQEPINENTEAKITENEAKMKSLETQLSQLKNDLMEEKSNSKKISEELASLQEELKTVKLETDKKLKDLSDQLEKEKHIVEAYKDMFQKILS